MNCVPGTEVMLVNDNWYSEAARHAFGSLKKGFIYTVNKVYPDTMYRENNNKIVHMDAVTLKELDVNFYDRPWPIPITNFKVINPKALDVFREIVKLPYSANRLRENDDGSKSAT